MLNHSVLAGLFALLLGVLSLACLALLRDPAASGQLRAILGLLVFGAGGACAVLLALAVQWSLEDRRERRQPVWLRGQRYGAKRD